jgi:hypothetical protein
MRIEVTFFNSAFYKIIFSSSLTILCSLVHAQVSISASGGSPSNPYTTLGAAFTAVNNGTVTGKIVITLSGNTNEGTSPAVLNASGSGSANYSSVLIRTTAQDTISGNPGSGRAVIELNGADSVTIDGDIAGGTTGRDLTIINTDAITGTAAIWVKSLGAGSGASRNTIRNCKILAGTNNNLSTVTFGIIAGGSTISATSAGADNDTLTIHNNDISRAVYGIYAGNDNSSSLDLLTITNNRIGSAKPSQYITFRGMLVTNALNGNFSGNRIYNMISANQVILRAMEFGANVTNSQITGNHIYEISHTSNLNFRSGQGISLASTSTTSNILVANNVIYGLKGHGSSARTNNSWGIMLLSGGGYNVHFNSINISDDRTPTGSVDIFGCVLVETVSNVSLRNNVLKISGEPGNVNAGNGYAVFYGSSGSPFANINYNDYFPNCTRCVVGSFASANRDSIADWKAVTLSDTNSIQWEPYFNSDQVLRPQPGSPLAGAGKPSGGVTTDFTGDTRSSSTPTIGAFEDTADALPPLISYLNLTNVSSTSNRVLTAFATITDKSGVMKASGVRPRLYYKKISDNNTYSGNSSSNNGWKYVEASNFSSPYSFTIDYSLLQGGSVSTGDVIHYFVIAQDSAAVPNVGIHTGVFDTEVSSVNLGSTAFPINDSIFTYRIGNTISGNVNVGSGQTYTSLTNAGGLFEYLNNNVVSGNLTVNVTSDLTAETGTYALNQTSESGTGNYFITIKPDAAVSRTISGTVTGGLIRLNGADRIIFDGSAGSSTTNYLNVSNLSTLTNTVTFHVISLGPGLGARNNTIKNCNISCGISAALGLNSGIYAGSSTIDWDWISGWGNDSLSILNNVFTKSWMGIYATGREGYPMKHLQIKGNTLGSTTSSNYVASYGILVAMADSALISKNYVFNILSDFVNPISQTGIMVYQGFRNSVISDNIVNGCRFTGVTAAGQGGKGIYVNVGDSSNVSIINNMISGIGGEGSTSLAGSATAGIKILGSSGDVKIYHNTVQLSGSISRTTSSDLSAALFLDAGVSKIDVRNNILINSILNSTGTAKAYAINNAGTNGAFTDINFNDYSVSGSQGVLGFLGSDRTTLTAWRSATGKDLRSVSRPVQFLGTFPGDLHLAGGSIGDFFLRGQKLTAVTTDIDEDTRYPVAPYMGADENTSFPLELKINAGKDSTVCSGTPVVLGGIPVVSGGQAPFGYVWSPAAGLSSVNVASPTATVYSNTTYTLIVTDVQGYSDTDTVVINSIPRLGGIQVLQGIPFAGTFSSGSVSSPDSVCNGDSVRYMITPPTGFTNASFGSSWSISAMSFQTSAGTLPVGSFSSIPPSSGGNGSFTFVPALADGDSTFIASVSFRNNATLCDTILLRYIKIFRKPQVNLGNDTTICAGVQLTLDAGPGASWNWSTGAGSRTIVVNTAGIYRVNVTNANGCSGSDTIEIFVNALPVINLGNDTTICDGSPLQLEGPFGQAAYDWSTGAGGRTITVSTAGDYILKVTGNNGCQNSDTVEVSTNPTPVVNVGADTAMCVVSKTLDAGAGFSAYKWNDNSIGQQLNVTSAGTYYVNVLNAFGCSGNDTIIITQKPVPVVNLGNDTSICGGDDLLLSAGAGFASYHWNDHSSQPDLTADSSGTYYVTVTNSSGCTATDSLKLTVVGRENAGFTKSPGTTGGSFTFTANSTTASSYNWNFGDGGTAITAVASHTYASNGNRTVTLVVTNSIGCTDSTSETINVLNVGITETWSPFLLNVYPNPCTGPATISYYLPSTGEVMLEIFDISGKKLLSPVSETQSAGNHVLQLDVNSLNMKAGIYLLRISSAGQSQLLRLQVTTH